MEISRQLQRCLPFYHFDQELTGNIRGYRLAREPYPDLDTMTAEDAASDTQLVVPIRNSQPSGEVSSSPRLDFSGLESLDLEAHMLTSGDTHEQLAANPSLDASLSQHVSPLYRRVLFSVSNNFVGLKGHSYETVIAYLVENTNEELYDIISSSSCDTAKAILRNLFKGAIEAGKHTVVEALLQNPNIDIDPNSEICHVSNDKWTPIERASALRHYAVITVLLESRYKVDVNKSFSMTGFRGALNNAICKTSRSSAMPIQFLKYERVDLRIFEKLLEAGGYVSRHTLSQVIKAGDGEIFTRIVQKLGNSYHREWNSNGIFKFAFEKLDLDTCEKLIGFLVYVGADLNYENRIYEPHHHIPNILNAIAERGSLRMVRTLIDHGATLTSDTLACAVSSGSLPMVKFFLGKRCMINDMRNTRITPLAAAIRLQSLEMMQLLEKEGAWASNMSKPQFSSALLAASEVGDVESLQRLVELGGDVAPANLGLALVKIVKGGHYQMAQVLIEAGADLDVESYLPSGARTALAQALERRDRGLFSLLLDAGANPNYSRNIDGGALNNRVPAIQLAVKWGDHEVVKRLIAEDVDVNDVGKWSNCRPALTIAIENQDEKLVSTLLEAGANPNNSRILSARHTALAAATRTGHVALVQLLLKHGADPDDAEALEAAYALGLCTIKEILLKRYRDTYRQPRKGFGSSILKQAVLQGDPEDINRLLKGKMDPWTITLDKDGVSRSSAFGTAIVTDQPKRNEIVAIFLGRESCRPNNIVAVLPQSVNPKGVLPAQTSLTAAVSTRDTSLVHLLVINGADVNPLAVGCIKRTPIQQAAEQGCCEMVQFLIRLGADVNAAPATRDGGTALQLAAASGSVRTVKTLLDYGADVDAKPSVNGLTAIEVAAKNGRLDALKLLLTVRKMQRKGNDGPQFERAKQYASQDGHVEIVRLLERDEEPSKHGDIMEIG